MKRFCCGLVIVLLAFNVFAWNAIGHQMVAAIAYQQLDKQAKTKVGRYLAATNKVYRPLGFVESSTWLDTIRYKDINWYDKLHYINIPFTRDGTPLPAVPDMNVVWGVQQSISILKSRYTNSFDKGMALRILIHIMGDLHQPLHTVSLVSHNIPNGDKGGNMYYINALPLANNLHKYWDSGAGYLVKRPPTSKASVKTLSKQLAAAYPCQKEQVISVSSWVAESNQLARTVAYAIPEGEKPSMQYQLTAQSLTRQRIALAGCRLAAVLNEVFS